MGWARFDDNYTDHPKVKPLSPLAELLDVRAIIRAARYTTDGLITPGTLKDISHQIPTVHKKVDELVAAGRWKTNPGGGWLIHDFLLYNPSKAEKEAQRAKGRERVQKHRRNAVTPDPVTRITLGDGTGIIRDNENDEQAAEIEVPAPWVAEGITWAEYHRRERERAAEV